MKKIFLGCLLLSTTLCTFAQTDWTKAGIEQLLKEYTAQIDLNNIAGTLDYVHPSVFKLRSKEEMIIEMEKSFNDPEIQVRLGNVQIKKISEVIEQKSIKYSLIDYKMDITMKHTPEDSKEIEEMNGFMLAMYEGIYGKENVVFDEVDKSFHITGKNQMFAIGDPEIGSWKILENKEGMEEMLGDVVPKKAKKKLAKL